MRSSRRSCTRTGCPPAPMFDLWSRRRCWSRSIVAFDCSLERAHVNGGSADAERDEQCLHDHGRTGDDEAADDGEFPGIGVATADRKAATNDTDCSEEEPNEHDDAQCATRALREGGAAASLRQNGCESNCEC